jgi:periplasmic nitrate reductase NapD
VHREHNRDPHLERARACAPGAHAGGCAADRDARGGADLHFAEAGKIIVTLEAATSGAIADRLSDIARLAGVLAATLVYHEVTTPEALGEPVCS